MKLTKSKLKEIIREEIQKLNEGDSVVVTVGINSMNPSHAKQVTQITNALKQYNKKHSTVYDNVVKTKKGSFISITVPKGDKNILIKYLRNVSSKVDGWDVLS